MLCTYVYVPATFAGMSMRGGPGLTPTSLYWPTGLVRPGKPGASPGPAEGAFGTTGPASGFGSGAAWAVRPYDGGICTLNSLSPSRSPYLTFFPFGAVTTPDFTDRLEAGAPRFAAASPSRACLAAAAAARICLPPDRIDELPAVMPWFGVRSVSFAIASI